MANLLQHIAALLLHVIDAPDSAPDTVEAARDLEPLIVDAINGNLNPFDEIVEPDAKG